MAAKNLSSYTNMVLFRQEDKIIIATIPMPTIIYTQFNALVTRFKPQGWFLPLVAFLEDLYWGAGCPGLTSFLRLCVLGPLSGWQVSLSGREWTEYPNLFLGRHSSTALVTSGR